MGTLFLTNTLGDWTPVPMMVMKLATVIQVTEMMDIGVNLPKCR
jgi:hypothetical protein